MKTNLPADLEARVANRRRELIAEIIEHKKNSCRYGAAEAIQRLSDQLGELASFVKQDNQQAITDWLAR
jgi:prephenate dehydrogenase